MVFGKIRDLSEVPFRFSTPPAPRQSNDAQLERPELVKVYLPSSNERVIACLRARKVVQMVVNLYNGGPDACPLTASEQ